MNNNNTNQAEMFLKDFPVDAQTAVTRQLASLSDAVTQAAMNWGFEVVKHLVVLNGAGLTAIVAIAQISGTASINHTLALTGAHIFVGGLIVALCSMLTIYATGLFFARSFTQGVLLFSIGKKPLSALRLSRFNKTLIGINWSLVVVSVALFVRGGFYIAAIT
ncbi:hypothetical protein [Burkholderia ubonensis]|uniref:hypothetical protein n=1 Tax=Burkholderia ubonensis TaxID=101571 RepID=UPI0012BA9B16|nr:hypothetical protein [Burkholderia ubonensis]